MQGNIYDYSRSVARASTSILSYDSQSSVDLLAGGAFGAEGSITWYRLIVRTFLYWSLKKENLLQALIFNKLNHFKPVELGFYVF